MNALKVTLLSTLPFEPGLNGYERLQGALYSLWRKVLPELHDVGYSERDKRFRMFVFSPIWEKGPVLGPWKAVSFEVRSPIEGAIDALAELLSERGTLRLGSFILPVIGLEAADHLLFYPEVVVQTLSPVTVHKTVYKQTAGSPQQKRTIFPSPNEEMFSALLSKNLASKLSVLHIPVAPEIKIEPEPDTISHRDMVFKGTKIKGWEGRFRLRAEPKVIAFLYYTGIGTRNSQGFGMFRIEAQFPAP